MSDTLTRTAPMRPGEYLAKRRAASGLSLNVLAALVAPPGDPKKNKTIQKQIADHVDLIGRLEADDITGCGWLVTKIAPHIKAVTGIYDTLVIHHHDAATEMPVPQICESCACSWTQPCVDHHGECCAWAADTGLCTRCAALETADAA